jgi:PAS domain S-box-containing protein
LKIGVGRIVPIAYRDANGKAVGFAIDVINEAARREGTAVTWMPIAKSVQEDLQSGTIDLVTSVIATEERKRKFYLSDPWWFEELAVLSRAGRPLKRLGIQQVYVELARPYFDPATFVLDRDGRVDTEVQAVCKDTLDGALITHGELHDLFLNRPEECNGVRLQSADTAISYGLSIMSRKSDEAIAKCLRKRIDDLVLDGTLIRFAAAHPPIPTSGAVDLGERIRERYTNRAWLTVGLALVLLVAFILWFLYNKQRGLRNLQVIERQLRVLYDRLNLKHEVARLGSYEWFPQENRVEWTPEMEALYGIKTGDHRHSFEEWKEFVYPEDLNATVTAITRATANQQQALDLTYRIIRPDGKVIWIHSRSKYVYNAEGRPAHVVGVLMDITDLKQGEMAQEILGGLLQICAACRRIYDGNTEEWYSMEGYLRRHSDAKFSHGMCPDCGKQWFSEGLDRDGKVRQS